MSDKQIEVFKIDSIQATEKSLMEMCSVYGDRMLKRASDDIRNLSQEKREHFLAKTIASIVKNENLKECFNSAEGKFSIYKLIDECLKTGLELEKHAYAIPYPRKIKRGNNEVWVKEASFQIRDRGYHVIVCGGNKPLFKDLRWSPVFEKEKNNISVNTGTGEVSHIACIDEDRGKIIGVWVQSIGLKGEKRAEFYPIKMIYNIRDNHSKPYQKYAEDLENYKKGINKFEPMKPAWITDEIPMCVKTAIKAFCKPYADVKDELAAAFYAENEDAPEETRSMEEVAADVIDIGIDHLKEPYIEVIDEPEEKTEPEKKNDTTPRTDPKLGKGAKSNIKEEKPTEEKKSTDPNCLF